MVKRTFSWIIFHTLCKARLQSRGQEERTNPHHTIFQDWQVALHPGVSEEFDISLSLAQYVSWMAGVGYTLDGSDAVQPQKTQLDHIFTWIVKLKTKRFTILAFILFYHEQLIVDFCIHYQVFIIINSSEVFTHLKPLIHPTEPLERFLTRVVFHPGFHGQLQSQQKEDKEDTHAKLNARFGWMPPV